MVLETFSVSHGKASAYLPVIDLLHGYFGIDSDDDGRKRREKAMDARQRSIREGDRVTAERRKPSNLPRATAVQHYLRFAFMPQQRRKPGLFALLLRKVPVEIDCL